MGLSVRALDKGFHRYVGTPPMAYLRQVRMARAHEELLASDPERTTASAVARNGVSATTVGSPLTMRAGSAANLPKRYAPSADIPNSDPGLITLQHSAI